MNTFCILCNKHFNNEYNFVQHSLSKAHLKKVAAYRPPPSPTGSIVISEISECASSPIKWPTTLIDRSCSPIKWPAVDAQQSPIKFPTSSVDVACSPISRFTSEEIKEMQRISNCRLRQAILYDCQLDNDDDDVIIIGEFSKRKEMDTF